MDPFTVFGLNINFFTTIPTYTCHIGAAYYFSDSLTNKYSDRDVNDLIKFFNKGAHIFFPGHDSVT